MTRRKKKLAAKYLVRRVVFALLVAALLALAAWGLWSLLGPDGEGEEPPESHSLAQSGESAPAEPEPSSGASEAAPESSQAEPEAPEVDPTDWRLILVNPTHPIDAELDIELASVGGYNFDSRITENIEALLAAAREDGISLAIISGYRTMERSEYLYHNKIAEYEAMGYDEATARVEAAKWVAPPGTSEHHTGLAMDIVSADYYTKYSDLVEEFENDPEAVWLKENCARFGFILRFPKDKVEITGINFEPWHFRYVGEEYAAQIMEAGICLEEFLGETE